MSNYFELKEDICRKNDAISPRLYAEYGVKRGTFLHQIPDLANTHRDKIHVTQVA